MPRDNFTLDIKRRLAQRAGYLCSICKVLTVGPSNESDLTVNLTGVAAHISAASNGPGARRYDANLSSQQRSNINNGIWLCNTHADLIDGDESTYTIESLNEIKKNHEISVKFAQSGINTSKGIITKIELSNFGKVKQPLILEFADNNVLKGKNGVGKTLVLELIASLSNKKVMKRWVNERRRKVNSFYSMEYFKNQLEKFTVSINKNHELSYEYNNAQIPFLAPPIKIIFMQENYWRFVNSLKDEVREKSTNIDLLSKYFKLKKKEFVSVIFSMIRNKKFFYNDIDIDLKKEELLINISWNKCYSFNSLSGGEQTRVLLEISLKIAAYYSKFNSTILLIDNEAVPTLDITGVNKLLKIVQTEKFNFQFIFTTLGEEDYDYIDFKIHHLGVVSGQTVLL